MNKETSTLRRVPKTPGGIKTPAPLSWEPFLEELSQALADCSDGALIKDFLRSILTPQEIQEVSTRWASVRFLDSGFSQRRIVRELGLSLCKITRGSRQLKDKSSGFSRMIELYKRRRPAPLGPARKGPGLVDAHDQ
ncbi:MAG: trp operon repressor [Spirochaetales bacterium]|nr:trp operon repressor [Spirochaetales bacterium]